jgi:hypothetical protein
LRSNAPQTAEDLITLFEILDIAKAGKIACSTLCDMFQEELRERAAKVGTVDLDEIIKTRLNEILSDSRVQRMHIIRAFMATSRVLEQEGRGFGKSFWGNKWKHYLFETFYTKANKNFSLPMKVATPEQQMKRRASLRKHAVRRQSTWFDELGGDNRYILLKQHLQLAAEGRHEGLRQALQSGAGAFRDITQPQVVNDFCGEWLSRLQKLEAESQQALHGPSVEG